jgi:ankyrin repeat protein
MVSDQNGDTALHIAAAMGRRKLTRILLEAGAERNLENKVRIVNHVISFLCITYTIITKKKKEFEECTSEE